MELGLDELLALRRVLRRVLVDDESASLASLRIARDVRENRAAFVIAV